MGIERERLAFFLTTMVLPGIPLLYYGDDQAFYLHDSNAENYVYGRQPMSSSGAWVLHGCFRGNASYQYYQIPFDKVRQGCHDISQGYDHFDVTSSQYTLLRQMHELRTVYPVFNDGFSLKTVSKSTQIVYADTTDYITNYSIFAFYLP
jgi:alpha-1,3-glucan synthase